MANWKAKVTVTTVMGEVHVFEGISNVSSGDGTFRFREPAPSFADHYFSIVNISHVTVEWDKGNPNEEPGPGPRTATINA